MQSVLVKGLIIGFALAAPVGPIAAVCVQKTMNRGLRAGLVSGLGSAAADLFYGTAAAFGASFISEFFLEHGNWLQRVGGVILVLLGLRLLLTRPRAEQHTARGHGLWGHFFTTFLLTFTNPMTFLAFTAIFATMGLGATRSQPFLTAELIAGLSAGALIWWTLLVLTVHTFRQHFSYEKLVWVNRIAGIFVVGVGVLYIFVLHGDAVEPRIERTLKRITFQRSNTPRSHVIAT